MSQDDEGVAVTAGGRDQRAGSLVAADGGHSTVRTLLGVAFPGVSARISMIVADVRLARKPAGLADDWRLPALESGFLLPLSGGRYRGGARWRGAATAGPRRTGRGGRDTAGVDGGTRPGDRAG